MDPLNGPVEVGIRALVLLTEVFPRRLDVAELVYLDHAVLHSGDFAGGPASLQPDLPIGPGELGLRRSLVEQGLVVLMRAGLADLTTDERGFLYGATEEAASFLDALTADYVGALKVRAAWLDEHYLRDGADVREDMKQITRRWADQLRAEAIGNRKDKDQ
ncbi:ABC-three component system middle component 2 [Kitasatospora phosalacinea]|uniref:ABC-three component system middle component 2 n=1 Tax=Kitasatospora phosalacinea TaxID=2065 RepID=UPI003668BF36